LEEGRTDAMNDPNDQPKRCHVCGKDVSSGWFARILAAGNWIVLCSPACAMRYYNSAHPEKDTSAQELTGGEHPLQFLVNGELWS